MRLAHLSTDPGIPYGGPKGAAVHLAELASAFAREGAETLLLVSGIAPGARPPPGVTLEVLPGPGRRASAAERLAFEPALVAWLEGRLRSFGAEFLYERLALHTAAGSAAAEALGVPHVVEVNAPLVEEAARYRALERREDAERLERATLSGADLVLVVSPPLVEYAVERGARCVEVVPNAVDVEKFPLRPRANGRASAIFTGRLRPWHGAETIAGAWRLLGGQAPSLIVVGDGEGRGLLEEVGAEVTGFVSHAEVPRMLARAEIGLAPYAADAPRYFSPLKLFEYLAASLAVVVADLPGVTDVVGPEAAVLVPAGDASALAEAVGELAADPGRRAALGRAGRALVEAEHTWLQRARRILAAVRDLQTDARAAHPLAPAEAAR